MMLRPGAGSCSPLPGLRELWAKSSHECDMASCHNHKLTFLILRGGGARLRAHWLLLWLRTSGSVEFTLPKTPHWKGSPDSCFREWKCRQGSWASPFAMGSQDFPDPWRSILSTSGCF